jgi:hypothetical protein
MTMMEYVYSSYGSVLQTNRRVRGRVCGQLVTVAFSVQRSQQVMEVACGVRAEGAVLCGRDACQDKLMQGEVRTKNSA